MDTVVNVAEQTKFYTDRTGVVGEREWLALQTQVVAHLTPKHLKDFIAAAETPTSVFVLVIILIQTTSFPHVLCSGVITQHAEVRLLLIVQLLKFTQLFAPNIQCTFVAIRKFSTPLNSCTRLWRKPGAFEITGWWSVLSHAKHMTSPRSGDLARSTVLSCLRLRSFDGPRPCSRPAPPRALRPPRTSAPRASSRPWRARKPYSSWCFFWKRGRSVSSRQG